MEPQVKHETEEKHEHEHEHPGEKPPTYEDLLEIIESQRQQLQKASIAIAERDQVIKERDQTIEQIRGSTGSALVANPSATTLTSDLSTNTPSTMDPPAPATTSAADRIAELEQKVYDLEDEVHFYQEGEKDARKELYQAEDDKMDLERKMRGLEMDIRVHQRTIDRQRTDLDTFTRKYGSLYLE